VTVESSIGPDPATLLFRHVFQARRQALFATRSPVADVAATDLGSQRELDGAFAAPGALDGADLAAVGRALATALRPGAPVLLCLGPRRPGLGRPGLAAARARLGPDFVWRGAFALGVIVPAASRQGWVRSHPQSFGVLAALEGLVRRWPLVRAAGDYLVVEGSRR
jgi:hypothetical protein